MTEKIWEIRIVDIKNISETARDQVIKEVAGKPKEFKENFKGFAKVTYVTASPPAIISVKAIEGTVIDYMKSIEEEGINFSVF